MQKRPDPWIDQQQRKLQSKAGCLSCFRQHIKCHFDNSQTQRHLGIPLKILKYMLKIRGFCVSQFCKVYFATLYVVDGAPVLHFRPIARSYSQTLLNTLERALLSFKMYILFAFSKVKKS